MGAAQVGEAFALLPALELAARRARLAQGLLPAGVAAGANHREVAVV